MPHSLPPTQCSGNKDLWTHIALFSSFFGAPLPRMVVSHPHSGLSPTHTVGHSLSNSQVCQEPLWMLPFTPLYIAPMTLSLTPPTLYVSISPLL